MSRSIILSLTVDGTFCQAALKGKIQIKEQLPKYLGGRVQLGMSPLHLLLPTLLPALYTHTTHTTALSSLLYSHYSVCGIGTGGSGPSYVRRYVRGKEVSAKELWSP